MQQRQLEPKYAYVHGVRDIEKPVDLQVHLRGNPTAAWRRGAARFPVGVESRRAR